MGFVEPSLCLIRLTTRSDPNNVAWFLMGDFLRFSPWSGGLVLLYFFLIIVKFLQLRGRRQIAEPRKYCLVRVIVFLWRVFSLFFCFSQVGNFGSNSLQLVSEPRVRFEWEQWQRKQERRLE